MGIESDENTKQYHAIDPAFFEAYLAIEPDLLIFACWLTRNREAGKDLMRDALKATLDSDRPWPVGITLKRHLRDAMTSIHRNRRKSKSELVLVRDPNVEPLPDAYSDEVSPYRNDPEECYADAEGTELAERMEGDVFVRTRPGSLERGLCVAARDGNVRVEEVARMLGVTTDQASDARVHLRVSKVRPVLHSYGLQDPKESRNTKDGE